MTDFDPNFLPVLGLILVGLAVEAALAVAAVAGLWAVGRSIAGVFVR